MNLNDILGKAYYRWVEPLLIPQRRAARLSAFGYSRTSELPDCDLNIQACGGTGPECVKLMKNFRHTALRYDIRTIGQPEPEGVPLLRPVILDLSRFADYDDYEATVQALSPRTLRKVRRARDHGYIVRRFALPMHVYDIHAIKTSTVMRSCGPVLAYWFLKPEDIAKPATKPIDWPRPACPCHWSVWWGVFEPAPGHRQGGVETNERLVAYGKIARCGELVRYLDLMGHRDHLENGVMFLMHMEIMRWLLHSEEKLAGGVKVFSYAALEHGGDGLLNWKRHTGFKPARFVIEASPVADPCGTQLPARKPPSRRADPAAIAKMKKIVSLCKRRGFIFPSSEIYGGLNGAWDCGPLGAELKRNLKAFWWKSMTQLRDDIVGFDGAILLQRAVWQASGHEATFSDPMVDCKICQARFRADQLDSSVCGRRPSKSPKTCGAELTEPRTFNLMLKTSVGPTEDAAAETYLRPEMAQAIFVQFKNVLESSERKLPFGIAQIGKAFRNEINPRNFTFRSREFEQMDVEFFVKPGTGLEWLEKWKEDRLSWYEQIGISREKIHVLTVSEKDRAFYSQGTYDLEYEFPFGIQELEGIAYRGEHDLKQHEEHSGQSLAYFDEETGTSYVPHVVEPGVGVDRAMLAVLCEGYSEEAVTHPRSQQPTRLVLRIVPRLAPIKAAILPLLRNRPQLVEKAQQIKRLLQPHMKVAYDQSGSIGKRYRRMDEVGTPFAVTVDFDTFEGAKEASISATGSEISIGQLDTVTVRHRDTMKQERIAVSDLPAYLLTKIA